MDSIEEDCQEMKEIMKELLLNDRQTEDTDSVIRRLEHDLELRQKNGYDFFFTYQQLRKSKQEDPDPVFQGVIDNKIEDCFNAIKNNEKSVSAIRDKIESLREENSSNYVTPRINQTNNISTRSHTTVSRESRQRKRNLLSEYDSEGENDMDVDNELDDSAIHEVTDRTLNEDILEERSVPDEFFDDIGEFH